VQLSDGRVAALAPANVILPAETRCAVAGLESAGVILIVIVIIIIIIYKCIIIIIIISLLL
jgi:hypothetical protein